MSGEKEPKIAPQSHGCNPMVRSLLHSREKAIEAARIAISKKAKDTLILELKNLSTITDYFIICSGESSTQVKTIAETIKEKFSKNKIFPRGKEGLNSARWVLMDYGDIVIHIFHEESRAYYELEKFWLDAPRIPIKERKA
jgi:ribosome-associated protein